MSESKGFWSYVHADDIAEGERISQLARDIVAQMEMLTGEGINLFLDKDAVEWGEKWRQRIDEGLSAVAFFIPVLTPRYFLSAECRRELNYFARKATALGVKELVLPLLYVDVPALRTDGQGDELVELIKTFNWEDLRDIRFQDRTSEGYRRCAARLAQRLVDANRKAEVSAIAAHRAPEESACEAEAPGIIDRLEALEVALPQLTESTKAIVADIVKLGEETMKATADVERVNRQGNGFAGRAMAVRRFAEGLNPIADGILSRANEFTKQIHTVDDGFRALIDLAPSAVEGDVASQQSVCELFAAIRAMNASASEGLGSLQGLIESMKPVETMSRDLRPPLRRLREGLTLLLEARDVIAEWVTNIDASGIDCTQFSAGAGALTDASA